MTEVVIRFCVPCRYQPKAMQDADAILKEFGEALSGVRLVPGDRGIYDVEVDGDLVFSLDKAMRFAEAPELIRKLRARIAPRRTRRKRYACPGHPSGGLSLGPSIDGRLWRAGDPHLTPRVSC